VKHKTTAGILFAAAAIFTVGVAPGDARAQIGDTDKSDKEIVASGIWILGYQDQGDASNTSLTVIGEGAFRYFIVDNLGVGLSGAAFYKTAGNDADDTGFIIQAQGSYYQSMSDSLYIAPSLGLGVTFGTRERPSGMPGVINEADILGFTATFGLPFVLFTPGPFNIRAGPEIIATFGSAEDIASGESEGFTTIDGGFKIGAGFNF
jgi:hypothetical protein